MNYEPNIVIDSTVVPGARFTVKKISVKRRAAFVLSIAEWTEKDRELRKQLDPLREEYRDALRAAGADPEAPRPEGEAFKIPEGFEFPIEKLARMSELAEKRKQIHGDLLTPAYIRCAFKSIDGFTMAGKAPDAEALIEDGPPELCSEISAAVDEAMGMSLEERLNLALLSTSGAGGGWENPKYDCAECRELDYRGQDDRNCRKYFPEDHDPRRRPCWFADYKTAKGTPYRVDGVETNECPVSLITPRSRELVTLFTGAEQVHKVSGGSLFGPDLGKWPTWAYDAQLTIARADTLEQAARFETELSERTPPRG